MKKLSWFKIGLILIVIGIVWIGVMFSEGEKISQRVMLKEAQTITLDIKLQNAGIGFYTITMPNYNGEALFVQIIDPNENVVADKKIETKMAVNYFDFEYGGTYILKTTNLSENGVDLEIEFGDANASEIRSPGVVIVIGFALMIISAYLRLKNYKMAQPDEKI